MKNFSTQRKIVLFNLVAQLKTRNSKLKTRTSGFTLIEMLLVAAIFAIVGSAAFIAVPSIRAKQILRTQTEQIASHIRATQTRSINAENQSTHGIQIDTVDNRLIYMECDEGCDNNPGSGFWDVTTTINLTDQITINLPGTITDPAVNSFLVFEQYDGTPQSLTINPETICIQNGRFSNNILIYSSQASIEITPIIPEACP